MPEKHISRRLRGVRSPRVAAVLLSLLALGCPAAGFADSPAASPTISDPFPTADPASVGLPARALELLAERVRAKVDSGEIVGGELRVIQNRRTVLHEAFGWHDEGKARPMELGALYCVRSMTKPLLGTLVLSLIEDGTLSLDTPIHRHLPAFDQPAMRALEVRHLLEHTGGFPFTTLGNALASYADLEAVATEAAAVELEFAPGSGFSYSDASSDILGALVTAVTGREVEQLLHERLLEPLGMEDSSTLLARAPAEIRQRIPTAYSGGTGAWTAHWSSDDGPLFPLFLPSQGLYSTTEDYARFLALWLDGGLLPSTRPPSSTRLLSPETVESALVPRHRIDGYPTAFGDLAVHYGRHWMVWADDAAPASAAIPAVFGHDGSDGTYAWAWPERDLMVLFFTQSRGTLAGIGLQNDIRQLLLDRDLDRPDPRFRPTRAELRSFRGLYFDQTAESAYYAVTPEPAEPFETGRLKVERPGRMLAYFVPGEARDRFVHEARADVWIEFVRDDEGRVTAMRTAFGGPVELDPKYVPDPSLPTVEQVLERVAKAHRIDRLAEVGPLRLVGTTRFESRGLEGRFVALVDGERRRIDSDFGTIRETVVRGRARAFGYNTSLGVSELEGAAREQLDLDSLPARFGDWRRFYEHIEVLKRVRQGERSALLVRVVPQEARGATLIVDEESGRVLVHDSLVQLPGLGVVGVRTQFGDFRQVAGMVLPHRSVAKFATPLVGSVVSTLDSVELGVEVTDETFARPSPGASSPAAPSPPAAVPTARPEGSGSGH